MGILADTCRELKQTLGDMESQCQSILDDVEQFDKHVNSYARERLTRKLSILGNWIIVCEKHLYEIHGGEGYVCVFLSEANGFGVNWVKEEEIVADKAWYQRCGSTVLCVKEATHIIIHMLNELASGNWAEVLDWVKKYAKSPGLVFSKYSEV